MARSIWSGSISFGLVNIPVTLSSAIEVKEVHFHLLHDADGARIAERRVCTADGKEVPWEHITKGYEIDKQQMVQVTTEELEGFAPEITRTIDIEQFVDLAEIDPVYFQKSYYAAAGRSGSKAYQLLAEAMAARGKVALGRVVLRQRQRLCAIRSREGQLVLSMMFYPDEIRQPAELAKSTRVDGKERALAEQLIDNLVAPFEPDAFHDEYREKLLAYLADKAEHKGTISTPAPDDTRAHVTTGSLVDALAASLRRQATTERRRRASPARRPARVRGRAPRRVAKS